MEQLRSGFYPCSLQGFHTERALPSTSGYRKTSVKPPPKSWDVPCSHNTFADISENIAGVQRAAAAPTRRNTTATLVKLQLEGN